MRSRLALHLVLGSCLLGFSTAAADPPDWVEAGPGLFEREGETWKRISVKEHMDEFRALIERCCEEYRVPFALPEGTTIVPGEDDKNYTPVRTLNGGRWASGPNDEIPIDGAKTSHGALDIGSRVSPDGGATIETLGREPVRPIHLGGYIRKEENDIIEQIILCEGENVQLVLKFRYGHVAPAKNVTWQWRPTPDANIGTLEKINFVALDPNFTVKGKHIHLEVEGHCTREEFWEVEMAHNKVIQDLPITEEERASLEFVTWFYNELLLPKLTGTGD